MSHNHSGEEKSSNENSRNIALVDSIREEINIIFQEIIKGYNDFIKEPHTINEAKDMIDTIKKLSGKIHDKMNRLEARIKEVSQNKTRKRTHKTEELVRKVKQLKDYYHDRITPRLSLMKTNLLQKKNVNNIANGLRSMSFKNKNNHKTKGGKRRRYPTKKRQNRKQ